MEDGLVLKKQFDELNKIRKVLILVVMEDGLVRDNVQLNAEERTMS